MTTETNKKPMVYVLSTCPRCRRVKAWLIEQGIDFDLVEVDLLPREERHKILIELRKHRPVVSFPVIETGDRVLLGTNVDEVKEVFGSAQ